MMRTLTLTLLALLAVAALSLVFIGAAELVRHADMPSGASEATTPGEATTTQAVLEAHELHQEVEIEHKQAALLAEQNVVLKEQLQALDEANRRLHKIIRKLESTEGR